MNMTLQEALARVRDYGPAIELRAGESGNYGEVGRRVRPASLLAALHSGELSRPALLVWNNHHSDKAPAPGEELGRIHLYSAPGHADATPALWIVQREALGEEGAR